MKYARKLHRHLLVLWLLTVSWGNAGPMPGFGIISGFPPGTTLKRAMIPNLTGASAQRYLFRAAEITLLEGGLVLARDVELVFRPGDPSAVKLVFKEARINPEQGTIMSDEPTKLWSERLQLTCSGLHASMDGSDLVLSGPCLMILESGSPGLLGKAGSGIHRSWPTHWENPPGSVSAIHLLAAWTARNAGEYLIQRLILQNKAPTTATVYGLGAVSVERDASSARICGPAVLVADGQGMAARDGFELQWHGSESAGRRTGPLPGWLKTLQGVGGVRGVAGGLAGQPWRVVEATEAKYTRASGSIRFRGGPVVVRTNDGEIRATSDDQYFRIRENGKFAPGPGQWLHRQEIELTHW